MLSCVPREIKKLISIPRVINCFHREWPVSENNTVHDYPAYSEAHDFWEIVYVETGSAKTYHGDDVICLHENQIFFCTPNVRHLTVSENLQYTVCHFISFESKSKIMSIFESRTFDLSDRLLRIMEDMIDMSKKTFTYLNTKSEKVYIKLLSDAPLGGLQMYKLYLEMLMIELIWHTNKTGKVFAYNSKTEFEKQIFNEIKKIAAENIYNSFSVQTVCDSINYCKSYVSAIFKRHSGMTIMDYYANLKTKEAKKLLKKKELSVSQISEILGYSSPYYFSYAFKKSVGISPTDYRKRH